MEALQEAVSPYYFWIKGIHVLSAAVWSFSTAVAYAYYLKPAIVAVRRHPNDAARRARLDDFMERFDRGAIFEHVALALMIATALLMIWIRDVDLLRWSFIPFLFWLGVIVITPMELVDIWLAHLGGNKTRVRQAGDPERYDRVLGWHLTFLRVTEPLVLVLVPTAFLVAIVKPF